MVGAAGDAAQLRRVPVVEKFRVEAVGPFSRLDVSEKDPRLANLLPVDVALPIGDVDALDRHRMGLGDALIRLLVRKHAERCGTSAEACRKYPHGDGNDRHAASIKRHQLGPDPSKVKTNLTKLRTFLLQGKSRMSAETVCQSRTRASDKVSCE